MTTQFYVVNLLLHRTNYNITTNHPPKNKITRKLKQSVSDNQLVKSFVHTYKDALRGEIRIVMTHNKKFK